jgi:hypothetical protein
MKSEQFVVTRDPLRVWSTRPLLCYVYGCKYYGNGVNSLVAEHYY